MFRSYGADGSSWRWAPKMDEPTHSQSMLSQGGCVPTTTMMIRIEQRRFLIRCLSVFERWMAERTVVAQNGRPGYRARMLGHTFYPPSAGYLWESSLLDSFTGPRRRGGAFFVA